jgi:hypothetical protein
MLSFQPFAENIIYHRETAANTVVGLGFFSRSIEYSRVIGTTRIASAHMQADFCVALKV